MQEYVRKSEYRHVVFFFVRERQKGIAALSHPIEFLFFSLQSYLFVIVNVFFLLVQVNLLIFTQIHAFPSTLMQSTTHILLHCFMFYILSDTHWHYYNKHRNCLFKQLSNGAHTGYADFFGVIRVEVTHRRGALRTTQPSCSR